MQTDSERVPLLPRALTVSAAFLMIPVSFVIVAVGAILLANHSKTTDQTFRWDNYYQEVVSQVFTLPLSEIAVVRAVHTDTAIMGESFVVEFRAPDESSPEVFLDRVAEASGFPSTYKRGTFLWDCQSECDLWRVQYLSENGLYRAEWGWD